MQNPVEQLTVNGLSVNIFYDEDAQSPDTWGDKSLYLMADNPDFSVRAKELREFCDGTQHKDVWVFQIEAYIHSGISLAFASTGNFPDRQWDVSHVGVIVASEKEFKTKNKAFDAAKALLEEWNQYLSGGVYRYQVVAPNGEVLDACGGYYGLDHAKEEASLAAKRESVDWNKKEKIRLNNIKHARTIIAGLKESNLIEESDAELLTEYINEAI